MFLQRAVCEQLGKRVDLACSSLTLDLVDVGWVDWRGKHPHRHSIGAMCACIGLKVILGPSAVKLLLFRLLHDTITHLSAVFGSPNASKVTRKALTDAERAWTRGWTLSRASARSIWDSKKCRQCADAEMTCHFALCVWREWLLARQLTHTQPGSCYHVLPCCWPLLCLV